MNLSLSSRILLAASVLILSIGITSTDVGMAAGSPVAALVDATAGPAARPDGGWVYPVGPPSGPGQVVREFSPPAQRWDAGHRGVDLRAPAGAPVRTAAAGSVTYAGLLAGRGVVVIEHGALRTTYEPVDATVPVGADVSAGDPIGTLATSGSHCAPASCLHWGARNGTAYVDPLSLVRSLEPRLLPLTDRALTEERPPPPPPPPDPPQPEQPPGAAGLDWPVRDPYVTSPYGMRTHPITGVHKLHDGTDFRAACGTPIVASAAGRVTSASDQGAYGLQVSIDHGTLGDLTMTTSYSHLSRFTVQSGQTVRAGEMIGSAGTTGMSTGCHLHFMAYADGAVADPMTWLPGGSSGDPDGGHSGAE